MHLVALAETGLGLCRRGWERASTLHLLRRRLMPSPFAVSQIWIWTALLVGSLTAPATAQTSRTALTPGTVVISNVGVKEVADRGTISSS